MSLQDVIDKLLSLKQKDCYRLGLVPCPIDVPTDFILAALINLEQKKIMPRHKITLKSMKAREIALYQMAFGEDWKNYKSDLNEKHKNWDIIFDNLQQERRVKIRDSAIQSITPRNIKVPTAIYESAKILLSEESSIYIRGKVGQ